MHCCCCRLAHWWLLFFLLPPPLMIGAAALAVAAAFHVQIRSPTTEQATAAQHVLLKEIARPYAVAPEYMLVANVIDACDEGAQVLAGFGQIRPITKRYSELASLFVLPDYRHQGIATKLIARLLERHDNLNTTTVCLLTLRPKAPLYLRHGFRIVDQYDLPIILQKEYTAGSRLGHDLVCMLRQ